MNKFMFMQALFYRAKFWSHNSHCRFLQTKSAETKLLKQLKARIKFNGPLTVAEYMKESLTNPSAGYYMSNDVFGSKGDFTTSPEITQMFGELIAVWLIHEWTKMGKCKPLQIVELGPGRGTLADDILRVFSKFEDVKDSVSLHLVEVSPYLRQMQRKKLCDCDSATGKWCTSRYSINVNWYDRVEDIPDAFTCFVAHEFFDALPIHKFVKKNNQWNEVLIDIDEGNGPHHLKYVLSGGPTPATKLFIKDDEIKNAIEVCPQAGSITEHICMHITANGGCALFADYGYGDSDNTTDTFRAFKGHKLHDPLCEPGCADMTSDVDFGYLKSIANRNGLAFGPVTQAAFLKSLGIDLRMKKLLMNSQEEDSKNLHSAYNMLTDPKQMGEKFKFLSIFPAVMKSFMDKVPPSGFPHQ